MAENFGEVVHTIGPAGKEELQFINHDEFNIKLCHADNPDKFILIDKQALYVMSDACKTVAKKYTV